MSTNCNPADIISRGSKPSDLMKNSLWWKGPPWLSQSQAHGPSRPDLDRRQLPDLKSAVLVVQPALPEFGVKFSSFSKLSRTTAWILRFLKKARRKETYLFKPYLTFLELRAAKLTLIRVSQHHTFMDVFPTLQKGNVLSSSHPLSSMSPYLDPDGVLRVGDRLQKAQLSMDMTHPILLSVKSHITQDLEEGHRRASTS